MMNGLAAFEKSLIKNKYIVTVQADVNDADYVSNTVVIDADKLSEVDFLMYSYFNLTLLGRWHGIPDNWNDVVLDDWDHGFGGYHVFRNRYWKGGWLRRYLKHNDFLTPSVDGLPTHSINKISMIYCDENGLAYDCKMIDLGSLFDSHQEFIDYITSLK